MINNKTWERIVKIRFFFCSEGKIFSRSIILIVYIIVVTRLLKIILENFTFSVRKRKETWKPNRRVSNIYFDAIIFRMGRNL